MKFWSGTRIPKSAGSIFDEEVSKLAEQIQEACGIAPAVLGDVNVKGNKTATAIECAEQERRRGRK